MLGLYLSMPSSITCKLQLVALGKYNTIPAWIFLVMYSFEIRASSNGMHVWQKAQYHDRHKNSMTQIKGKEEVSNT